MNHLGSSWQFLMNNIALHITIVALDVLRIGVRIWSACEDTRCFGLTELGRNSASEDNSDRLAFRQHGESDMVERRQLGEQGWVGPLGPLRPLGASDQLGPLGRLGELDMAPVTPGRGTPKASG